MFEAQGKNCSNIADTSSQSHLFTSCKYKSWLEAAVSNSNFSNFLIYPNLGLNLKVNHLMNVICLEEAAFYELVEQVVNRLKENQQRRLN
jgi:hypothetical protein